MDQRAKMLALGDTHYPTSKTPTDEQKVLCILARYEDGLLFSDFDKINQNNF